MSPFLLTAFQTPIKGASHKTMKNTRGEREGGRQPRPRKLPNGAHGDIQKCPYPHGWGHMQKSSFSCS